MRLAETPFFTKIHGDDYRGDWDRVCGLYEASLIGSDLNTPKPIRLNPESRSITYEKLPQGRTLAGTIYLHLRMPWKRTTPSLLEPIEATGASLAHLHKHMTLPFEGIIDVDFSHTQGIDQRLAERTCKSINAGPIAYFHGDFGMVNVWISRLTQEPYVLDPIPSRFCPDRTAGRAPIYFDIGQMVSTFWGIYPLWVYPGLNWIKVRSYTEAFLTGYQHYAGFRLDRRLVFTMALWLFDAHVRMSRAEFKGASPIRAYYFRRVREIILAEALR